MTAWAIICRAQPATATGRTRRIAGQSAAADEAYNWWRSCLSMCAKPFPACANGRNSISALRCERCWHASARYSSRSKCDLPGLLDNYLVADCLLRCIQEAIANTLKHSDATLMRLDFAADASEYRLTLHDNGCHSRRSDWSSGQRSERHAATGCCGARQCRLAQCRWFRDRHSGTGGRAGLTCAKCQDPIFCRKIYTCALVILPE